MATQTVITKPFLPDYSDVEPLPDPPTRPDIEQFQVKREGCTNTGNLIRRTASIMTRLLEATLWAMMVGVILSR